MLIVCKNMGDIIQLKKALNSEFEMKDLVAAKKILGIEISRDRKKGILSLSQKKACTKGTKGIWYVGYKSYFYTYTFTLQVQVCQGFNF